MSNEIPTMLTIVETAQKTGLAKHYIRQCCLQNKIVHIRCGKRILINFGKFCEFLNTNTGEKVIENEPQTKIRQLNK